MNEDFSVFTTERLRELISKGTKLLLAYEMGDLADMRVASMQYDYGSEEVLDQNFKRTEKLRVALTKARAELAKR